MENLPKGQHIEQKLSYDCGASAYRKILDLFGISISHLEACQDAKLKKSGTATENVVVSLKRKIGNREINRVSLLTDFEQYKHWLDLNSKHNVIYLSSTYISNSGRGRNSKREHAVCVFNGFIFDPSEKRPVPIESYSYVFNKKLFLKEMVMVAT